MGEKNVDVKIRFSSNIAKVGDQVTGKLKKMSESAKRIAKENKEFGKIARTSGFGSVLLMNNEQLATFNKRGKQFQNRSARMANSIRLATHGLRGFRMEMLGVMFFGMAITRMFKGLIQPALQMSGAMELLSAVLGIIFLPFGLALIEFAVALLEKWEGLSDKTKKWINIIVAAGIGLGLFLQIFGALALGIGSFILVLGTLLSIFKFVGIALGGLILIGALFGLTAKDVAAATEGMNSKLNSSEGIFSRLKEKVSELWERLSQTETFQFFAEAWSNMWKTVAEDPILGTLINVLPTLLKNKFNKAFDSIGTNATGMFETLKTKFDEFKISLTDGELSVTNFGKAFNLLKSIFEEFISPVVSRLLDFLQSIVDIAAEILPDFFKTIIGSTIVGAGVGTIVGPIGTGAGAIGGAGVGTVLAIEDLIIAIQEMIAASRDNTNSLNNIDLQPTPGGTISTGDGGTTGVGIGTPLI